MLVKVNQEINTSICPFDNQTNDILIELKASLGKPELWNIQHYTKNIYNMCNFNTYNFFSAHIWPE